MLKMPQVRESDRGLYSCLASNEAGEARRNFSLEVLGESQALLHLSGVWTNPDFSFGFYFCFILLCFWIQPPKKCSGVWGIIPGDSQLIALDLSVLMQELLDMSRPCHAGGHPDPASNIAEASWVSPVMFRGP